ncbi:MAG TPA: hypothetical protein VK138_06735 [Acidiferrobacterales bacterium]|nr:hypothetical protein [Acidiferrobacterales bacterium]
MTLPTITIGSTSYLHTNPVLSHKIKTDKFEYRAETVKNIDECTLRTLKGDFDLGETSLATFLKLQEKSSDFKGLPVFSRKFVPQYAFCAQDSRLHQASELRGKKVAVFQYWVTASIWHRWLLKHYYQVDPAEIIWCPLRQDRMENMPYPENYRLEWKYLNGSPEALLRNGDVDCFFYARRPDDFAGLRYLVPDAIGEGMQFLKETKIMPITHVMAVKNELLARYPWMVEELMKLFDQARLQVYKEIGHISSQYLPFADLYIEQMESLLGRSWNEYGWSKNEEVLATFYNAACEQGFVKKNADWRDGFVHYQ